LPNWITLLDVFLCTLGAVTGGFGIRVIGGALLRLARGGVDTKVDLPDWPILTAVLSTCVGACVGFYFLIRTNIESPTALVEEGRYQGYAHSYSLLALGIGGFLMFAALGLVTAASLVIARAFRFDASCPELSEEERRAMITRLSSDELWRQDLHAVAAHVHACWKVAMPDDWDSDEPLWDLVEAQLRARYASEHARARALDEIHGCFSKLVDADDRK
jgi:hypothetical protein